MARYSGLRQECAKALDKDFLDLSVPERLALVQVLHAMGPEGQVVVRGSDVFCPRPSPKKDAPLMLVAEPGSVCLPGACMCIFIFMFFCYESVRAASLCILTRTLLHLSRSGCSTAIALALRDAKRLPPEGPVEELVFDHIIPGAVFLRFVGCSSCANDGQSLLRSLVIEMRSILEPESCQERAIPTNNHEIEVDLVNCLRLASVECPITVVVDGVDRLCDEDPIKNLLWLPKELPKHCRFIVSSMPASCSAPVRAAFPTPNIIHLEPPTAQELSALIHSSKVSEPYAQAMLAMAMQMPNLSLLRIMTLHHHISRRISPRNLGACAPGHSVALPLTLGAETGAIELHLGSFSQKALVCLGLLALCRHGLSAVALACGCQRFLFNGQVQQSSASSKPIWERDYEPAGVGFDSDFASIRHFLRTLSHGRCIVMQLSPLIRRAVLASEYFLQNREKLCQALLLVFCEDHAVAGIPQYQVLAELPSLQLQLASFTGEFASEGPASLHATVCSLGFVQLKVEAGLLEDCLKDFRTIFHVLHQQELAGGSALLANLQHSCNRVLSVMRMLVKPFHACTLWQLHDAARDEVSAISTDHVSMHKNAGDAVADIDAEEPQATFVETSGSNAPLVQCTASLATGESISCLAIASSPAAPRVALGLHDGHVVILDLALFERLRKFPAHVHSVACMAFVHDPSPRGISIPTRMLLTAAQGGEIMGWQPETGVLIFRCDAVRETVSMYLDATPTTEEYYAGLARCDTCVLRHRVDSIDSSPVVTPLPAPLSRLEDQGAGIEWLPKGRSITCMAASLLQATAAGPFFLMIVGSEDGVIAIWKYRYDQGSGTAGNESMTLHAKVPPDPGARGRINHLAFARSQGAANASDTAAPLVFASAAAGSVKVWKCDGTGAECLQTMPEANEAMWCALDMPALGMEDFILYSSGQGFLHQWRLDPTAGCAAAVCDKMPGSRSAEAEPAERPEAAREDAGDERNVILRKACLLRCGSHDGDAAVGARRQVVSQVVLAFSDLSLVCWDVGGEQVEHVQQSKRLVDCAFSLDASLAVSASRDGSLRLWRARSHSQPPPGGGRQAVGSLDAVMAAYAVQHGGHGGTKTSPAPAGAVPEGAQSGMRAGLLLKKHSHHGPVKGVSLSSDGRWAVSVGGGEALFWKTQKINGATSGAQGGGVPAARIGALLTQGPRVRASSGAAFYLSAECGTVEQAAFAPKLQTVGPKALVEELEPLLVLVVWSSHRIDLFSIADLRRPLSTVQAAGRLSVRVCKLLPNCSIACGASDGALRMWRFEYALHRNQPDDDQTPLPEATARAPDPPPPGSAGPNDVGGAGAGAGGLGRDRLRAAAELLAARRAMVKRVTVSLSLEAAHLGAVLDVACCPQGTYLASASVDHSVSVWRLRGFYEGDTRVSGRLPRRGDQAHQAVLQGDRVRAWAGQHGSYVQAVAFSTASVLASVGGDRICRLWDVETGTMLHLLKCSGALSCVNFSPSGHLVAAGGWLGALGVWDVGSGRELAGKPHPVLLHHHDSVSSVSWTPDSRALVVCSSDGIVWAWDVVKGRFLGGRACAAGNYMLDDSHEAVQEAQHLKLHRFEDHGMASSAVFFSQSFLGAGLHSQSYRSLTLFPVLQRPFLAPGRS